MDPQSQTIWMPCLGGRKTVGSVRTSTASSRFHDIKEGDALKIDSCASVRL